tara:strand:+ start:137 stop:1552 length:1416 start_codon:yes stop_codon:yes gene_type:complete
MTRKTKIIATIGPATFSKEIIKRLVLRGVNVCRINFSHIDHAKAKEVINSIKEVNQELHVHTAILADLQGPKIRIGELEKPMRLTKGMQITLCTRKRKGKIYVNYSKFAKEVCVNDKVLIDDGKLILIATHTNHKDTVRLKVVFGGMLYSNKGINLPNTKISMPCLTHKDKQDLKFVLNEKIEWIGLSFVRSAEDVKKLKRIIKLKKSHHKVIAKIEKPQAIKDIDAIIQETDAIMVARGDLGVEVLPQKVPVYQKMIVEKCIKHSKPVVIATQMLESMTKNPTATRAEVNDVANSVIDGADAVMLSGETSVGKHPLKSVDTMRKIIRDIERSEHSISKNRDTTQFKLNNRFVSDAVCSNACIVAEQTKAKAIITITYSGYNTIKTSSYRPTAFIYAFTNNHTILNTLSLVWGVQGFYYDKGPTTDQTIEDTKQILKKGKFIKKGDHVVNLASMPAHEKGMTNMMKISKVK